MAGRKPLGPALVEHLDGSTSAKERLELILATIAGRVSVVAASRRLGISEAMFYKLRTRVLQGCLEEFVIGHSNPTTAGTMKSGRFERSEIRRRYSATPHGLPETDDGECPQDGDCTVDSTVIRGRLVTAADRPRVGDRSRNGVSILTTAPAGFKTSHCAHRLRRAKCSHNFALSGSGARADGW